MGWERRGGHAYFYRTVRVNGRLSREYYGRGPEAARAAAVQALRRAARQAAAEARRVEGERWAAVVEAARPLDDLAALLVSASLVAAGYHQHQRTWRKRSHGRPDPAPGRGGRADGGGA
jgi:hypothetical protein